MRHFNKFPIDNNGIFFFFLFLVFGCCCFGFFFFAKFLSPRITLYDIELVYILLILNMSN